MGLLEQEAAQGKAASQILNQMINSGVAQQDTENTVILNAANGEHRFGANPPQADEGGE